MGVSESNKCLNFKKFNCYLGVLVEYNVNYLFVYLDKKQYKSKHKTDEYINKIL